MQIYDLNPDFDLETEYLTVADDLNAMNDGQQSAFDPTKTREASL